MLIFSRRKWGDNLESEGFTYHWFPYAQLMKDLSWITRIMNLKRIKLNLIGLCSNNDHIIAKMYKLLLKTETVDKLKIV